MRILLGIYEFYIGIYFLADLVETQKIEREQVKASKVIERSNR